MFGAEPRIKETVSKEQSHLKVLGKKEVWEKERSKSLSLLVSHKMTACCFMQSLFFLKRKNLSADISGKFPRK